MQSEKSNRTKDIRGCDSMIEFLIVYRDVERYVMEGYKGKELLINKVVTSS
jgi:hypothetical protein